MNLMNIFRMIKNPQQLMQQIAGNNKIMSNPIVQNVMQMAQQGNMRGVEQMARNLCQEKNLNADEVFNQVKGRFGN